MKKLALICLSPIVLVSMAFAGGQNAPAYSHPKAKPAPVHAKRHHFTGFSVTGAVGGVASELDAKQNFQGRSFAGDSAGGVDGTFGFEVNGTLVASDSLELMDQNIAGWIGLEYAYQFSNGLVLGLAATAGFDNLSYNNTLAASAIPSVTDLDGLPDILNGNLGMSSSLKVEMENDFAILFKPGFVIRENTQVYALVGPRWGNFETSLTTRYNSNGTAVVDDDLLAVNADPTNGWNSTLTGSSSSSEYHIGITAGVGVRQVLVDHVMLGLEYAYTHYGDLDSLQNAAEPGILFADSTGAVGTDSTDLFMDYVTNAQNMILNTHTFMATLSYTF